jgi:hypothetical protein
MKTGPIHFLLHSLGERNNLCERHATAWVEIDRRRIGKTLTLRGHARLPRVYLDRSDLHRVKQRQQISAYDAIGVFPAFGDYPPRPHPFGHRFHVLLKERRALDAVWKTLQDQRAIRDRRKDQRGDRGVVAHDVALREAILREVQFVQAAHVE